MTKTLSLLILTGAAATLQAQGPNAISAARFLGDASWGPSPSSMASLQTSTLDTNATFAKYIADQFAIPPSPLNDVPIVPPATRASFTPLQAQFFQNAVNGNDQLRQRVAFALSKIWVISGVKINDANQFLPYYRILLNDASKNYYDVMYDITVNPGMGHYLDMVNNDVPPAKSLNSPNENYAREILQLFTVGTVLLNEDGTPVLDGSGNPVPTYSQDVIEGLAHVFTGWTYAPMDPNAKTVGHNPANYARPMVTVERLHDTAPKLVLGDTLPYQVTLPYQGSAAKDLNAALKLIFDNPNLPPFVCKQLIQQLVTSNPSPAYVQRVVNVFKSNSAGVRGDMPSVIQAILLDPEARTGDDPSTFNTAAHLREPALYITGLMRALSVPVSATNNLSGYSSNMGQNVFFPATVFSYFSPEYQVPGASLSGPEFGIYSPSSSMVRADFINSLVYGNLGLDLTGFQKAAANVTTLESMVNDTLLHGVMSTQLKSAIEAVYASIPVTGNTPAQIAAAAKQRAQAALYLTAVSPEYQVQR